MRRHTSSGRVGRLQLQWCMHPYTLVAGDAHSRCVVSLRVSATASKQLLQHCNMHCTVFLPTADTSAGTERLINLRRPQRLNHFPGAAPRCCSAVDSCHCCRRGCCCRGLPCGVYAVRSALPAVPAPSRALLGGAFAYTPSLVCCRPHYDGRHAGDSAQEGAGPQLGQHEASSGCSLVQAHRLMDAQIRVAAAGCIRKQAGGHAAAALVVDTIRLALAAAAQGDVPPGLRLQPPHLPAAGDGRCLCRRAGRWGCCLSV